MRGVLMVVKEGVSEEVTRHLVLQDYEESDL